MDHSLFSFAPETLTSLTFQNYVSIVLTDICRSFLCVSNVTQKIKTRSKPTPSENFNSHPLYYVLLILSILIF
jgi:hypothetical protein